MADNGKMKNRGYIYFAQAENRSLFKIGMTINDPSKRIAELSTGCPYKISPLGWFECIEPEMVELRVHSDFNQYRTKGEWFEVDREIVKQAIEGYKIEFEIPLNFDQYYACIPMDESKEDGLTQIDQPKHWLVLMSTIGEDGISVYTVTCPFCGKKHQHGTGGLSSPIEVSGEYLTLGHRSSHCTKKDKVILLPNGIKVSNSDGYFLGLEPIKKSGIDEKKRISVKEYIIMIQQQKSRR